MSFAQDAKSVMAAVAKAMGSDNLKTLHYSGSGSSYVLTQNPAVHCVMKSYVRDINFDAGTSKVDLVRVEGTPPADKSLTQTVVAGSSWSSQYPFWLTPYGFLKGALADNASLETKKVYGDSYRTLSFTLPGNHKVVGYINDKDLIDRIETWIGDGADVHVEAMYRDYTDFNGFKFPTLITEKQAGELSLVLVVKDVKAGK